MKMIKIIFEDQGQDLVSVELMSVNKEIGQIISVTLGCLSHLYKDKFVDMKTIKEGKNLGVLNFEDRCTEYIKYPIAKIIKSK